MSSTLVSIASTLECIFLTSWVTAVTRSPMASTWSPRAMLSMMCFNILLMSSMLRLSDMVKK